MNDIHLNSQVTSDKDNGSGSTAYVFCKTHRSFIDSMTFKNCQGLAFQKSLDGPGSAGSDVADGVEKKAAIGPPFWEDGRKQTGSTP